MAGGAQAQKMSFAGHMAVAYFLDRAFLKKGASFSLPLIFAAAMLPDMDFMLSPLFPHHSITHSLTFWAAVYVPIFAVFGWRRAVPYAIATFSHFLIGDVITGNPPLLFGLSDARFGLVAPWVFENYGLEYGALYQSLADAAMAAAFALFAFRTGSIRTVWSGAHNPWHVLALAAIVALVFFGAARAEVVAGLKQSPGTILYVSYAVVALAQLAFILPFIIGRRAGSGEEGEELEEEGRLPATASSSSKATLR